MARKRGKTYSVKCPLCASRHHVSGSVWLYKTPLLWAGYITFVWCDERHTSFYKLYDENFRYVCWQQNTRSEVPDYQDIPF